MRLKLKKVSSKN